MAVNTPAQSIDQINPLKPGEMVPDIQFPYVTNGSYQATKISDHRGKILILGFWSMTCPPCIKNFPNLDSLQKQFGNKVSILLINVNHSNETKEKITAFLAKWKKNHQRQFDLPTIYNDTIARKLFNCIYAPHYAWISPEGRLLALTGSEDVNAIQIGRLLQDDKTILPVKNDVDYKKPLFAKDILPVEQVLLHSVFLKGYYHGLGDSRYYFSENSQAYGFNIANQPLLTILEEISFQMDKEVTRNRIMVDAGEGADSNMVRRLRKELNTEIFSIGTIVPKDHPEELLPTILATINKHTDYEARFEKRKVSCYALVSLVKKRQLRTEGSNPISGLYRTQNPILQNGSHTKLIPLLNQVADIDLPVIDRTGIKFNVDLYFNRPLREFKVIQEELKCYNLGFRKKKARLKMLVIRKKSPIPGS